LDNYLLFFLHLISIEIIYFGHLIDIEMMAGSRRVLVDFHFAMEGRMYLFLEGAQLRLLDCTNAWYHRSE
jgi:hypothetical protein